MYPLLVAISDNEIYTLSEVKVKLAKHFDLTEEEISKLLPSGYQEVFYNRIGWARTYLKKAGLIEYVSRGMFRITKEGLMKLRNDKTSITLDDLEQYDSFQEFIKVDNNLKEADPNTETPEEEVERYFKLANESLEEELLDKIKNNSPIFFENLVIDVILQLGYGGSGKQAKTTLRSHDEGVDGVVNEDKLGFDTIYIQAKRYTLNPVGRPEMQQFAGALQGKRATKGIFITTTDFTNAVHEYVANIGVKIVLINGSELAKLMIDNNIGVNDRYIYKVKDLDLDYFTESD